MSRRAVLLIGTQDLGWTSLRRTAQALTDVEVIDAPTAARALIDAATLTPVLIVIADRLAGCSTIPIIQALRDASPSSRIAIFAPRVDATMVDELVALQPLGVAGYLVWSEMTSAGLQHSIGALLEAEVRIASESAIQACVGLQVVRRRNGGTIRLTNRETEVLALLTAGATDDDIAARLHISDRTVQSHVRNICLKLGACTRWHAAMLAVAQGLVEV